MAGGDWDRYEIVLAGTGGQGLVFLGNVLGQAAVMGSDLHATVTQSFGIASRGGFTKAEVVLSPGPVAYPRVKKPDLVLALSSEALDRYRDAVGRDAWLIYVARQLELDASGRRIGLSLMETAREEGVSGSINVMALGAVVEIMDLLSPEAVTGVLGEPAGPRAEANMKAFRLGQRLGREAIKG